MMTDLGKYWKFVRREEQQLPAGLFVFIISVENEEHGPNACAGRIVEVTREAAAERMVAKTHRLATDEEIEQFRDCQRAEADRIARAEFDKRQPLAITVHGDGTARVSKGTPK